jgi:hypothetical protein
MLQNKTKTKDIILFIQLIGYLTKTSFSRALIVLLTGSAKSLLPLRSRENILYRKILAS